MAKEKDTKNPANRGQGAKPKYNEPTVSVGFRCPTSKVPELRETVNKKLKSWQVKK